MRLKFLFFPIIIVISLSVFIGYIWPEFKNLKDANTEKKSQQEALKAIMDKNTAIKSIDDQISKDSEGNNMVNNYLPSKKIEERILTGINFLATDSGVTLTDVAISDGSSMDKKNDDSTRFSISSLAAISNGNVAGTENGSGSVKSEDGLNATSANISVTGDYDKIRLFIDQLQKMSIFNSIRSLSISAQATDGQNNEEASQESVPASSGVLLANISVDFGWMRTAEITNHKIANFKPMLDNSTIQIVKEYIHQKAPAADRFGNEDGKRNPFVR